MTGLGVFPAGRFHEYKNGQRVYFVKHATVWYTSTGGAQALDGMLGDRAAALIR